MLPSIKRCLAALGPVAIPFADTTPGIWLLDTRPLQASPAAAGEAGLTPQEAPEAHPRAHTRPSAAPGGRSGGASGC